VQRALQHGADPQAALALAEALTHLERRAEAYRAVERRLALGLTLEQAEEILLA